MRNCIHTEGLSIGYGRKKKDPTILAEELNLNAPKGELVALVGPNGCGKSTLLRTLAGLHLPLKGRVKIEGETIHERSAKERAKLLSIVLTGLNAPTNLKVIDLVSLGRSPYRPLFMPWSEEDGEAVREAIEQSGIEHLAEKTLDTLSDGEAQKVMIARALAQRTQALILDEPTAHLDLINRVEIARMLREIARERGEAIVMASHDLETILRIVDRVWLMAKDGTIRDGIPEELAMTGAFSDVFASRKLTFDRNNGSFRFLETPCGTITLEGEGLEAFWTQRALERIGYRIGTSSDPENEGTLRIENGEWIMNGQRYRSLEDLIHYLGPTAY